MWTFNSFDDVLQRGCHIVGGVPGVFMSPVTGGTTNPYAAAVGITGDEKAYNVATLAKIDGIVFGMFQMSSSPLDYPHSLGPSNHAEDGFISAFEAFTRTAFYEALVSVHDGLHKPVSITLKQTKTPCEKCAPKLIEFKKKYDVELRIKAMIQYRGNVKSAQAATQQLVQAGIPVIPFNVPRLTAAKKYGHNHWGQEHELKYARFDEKEFDEDQYQQAMKQITLLMKQYREAFDRKDEELANVVLAALEGTDKVDKSKMHEILQTAYKTTGKRVTKQDASVLAERLLKGITFVEKYRALQKQLQTS